MQQTLIPAAITPTPTPATATPAITATPVVEVRPMHFANFLQLDNNGNYNVSWVYNNSMDTLHFMVEVKTTGWIGFGVATQAPNMMMNYDVAVGGVSGGAGYLWDYLTVGRRLPQLDLQQDWMLTYFREENNVTTLRFYRQRDTNDSANDTVIQPGMSIFLVWAYHPSLDAQPSSFSGHSNDARGFMQQTLIPAAITPTPTPATATPAITATPVVEVRPMHFANFLQLDNNGNYNVSWVYNNSMDTLHFMVEVKTTGWIGFGVATQAPNMMMNYDVAVGGVSGGAGYLWDYLTVGRRLPQLDLQQDWMLTYFREENNVTTLRFYRQRDTNDSANDTVIQPGMSIFLVWAYHPSLDAQPSSFSGHSNDARGFMQQTLIPAAITPTPTPATATPAITATPVVEVRPMHFANFLQLDNNGNYNVSWVYNNSMDTLHFMVEVKTTGWIGFGVATQAPNMMMNYDVAVGGVSGGAGYLWDYLTVGRRLPQLDLQQDWMLTYFREENNVTTLRFYRQRDTNDSANDTVIQPGMSIFLVWAYHPSLDAQPSSFSGHSNDARGFMQQTLIPAAITPTPTPATATPAITATPVVEVRPMHFANFLQLDNNGNYNVSWVYNNSMDTLHFMVEVKTTGWIGFGVATQAPNMMMNYDVAVGGVSGGAGYLWDYLTVGRRLPQLDLQQDWMLTYFREENNVTTLRFYRQRDTNDSANDTVIQPGMSIFLVWAYHPSLDAQPSSFSGHSNDARGFMQQTLIPAAITPTPTPATATPAITATPVVEVRPMHFANFLQLDNNGNYNVSWVYNNSMDTLHFMVEVKTTGWIGFGVATQAPNMMMNYDVAVGGVSGGAGYLWDYLTVGRRLPQLDLQQDWMLTYFREENNVTTLRFYRQRDTNDSANDTVIQPGMSIFLVWAYHPSLDAQPSSFSGHSNDARGFMQQTLIPAAITPTPTPATATPAITATPVVEVRPMHFANFLQLDNNGNYNVSWVYNNSMDTLHFMVEVKTTGWIGFGVATQAPNMMMNYDVAVGGVSGGAGYLWDYLTVGRRLPQLDLQQDWMLTYFREENNVTTLRFYRQRDTNDSANDTVIQPGMSIYVVWAYHPSLDAQPSSFSGHSNDARGFMQQTLIPAAITPTPTPGPTPTPKIYQNNAIFDNGNFKVYWSYNSSADSLYFTLDVAAVGWIGFGFSENNMGMNGYDVAVGGVRNGQMYLQDYITNGYMPPNADQQQDVNLMYAIERDGRTMISYTRKRDTGDLNGDLAIERGKQYYFIWAYHSNSDNNVLDKHQKRGFQRMVVIAADVVETTPAATTGPNQGGEAGQGGGPVVGNLSYYFSSS
ncbi:uncharacterized protein [Porites lutea]|uniref:uncharacterized protein n=1 Tax=Porites lutea TaxID=51062 RepID=UPI003CC67760